MKIVFHQFLHPRDQKYTAEFWKFKKYWANINNNVKSDIQNNPKNLTKAAIKLKPQL